MIDVADVVAQAPGAAHTRAVHQTAGKAFDIVERHVASFEPPRQIECHVENRIERWIVRDLCAETLQFIDKRRFIKLHGSHHFCRSLQN